MESIVVELRGTYGNLLYAKRGITVIHYGNITLRPLGYESNHLVRTMVTYLPIMIRDTPQLQVLWVLR